MISTSPILTQSGFGTVALLASIRACNGTPKRLAIFDIVSLAWTTYVCWVGAGTAVATSGVAEAAAVLAPGLALGAPPAWGVVISPISVGRKNRATAAMTRAT